MTLRFRLCPSRVLGRSVRSNSEMLVTTSKEVEFNMLIVFGFADQSFLSVITAKITPALFNASRAPHGTRQSAI